MSCHGGDDEPVGEADEEQRSVVHELPSSKLPTKPQTELNEPPLSSVLVMQKLRHLKFTQQQKMVMSSPE